jgi:DNA-binding response OmpR family regulator
MTERYTIAEGDLIRLLSDGEPHTKKEIRESVMCMDEFTSDNSIRGLVARVRKKLKVRAEDIVSVMTNSKGLCYRHVRLLYPSSKE